jgi:transposase
MATVATAPQEIDRDRAAIAAGDWAEVQRLAGAGVSQREIARRLTIDRRRVARMIAADAPLPPHHGRRGSQLDRMIPRIEAALAEQPDIRAPALTELLRSDCAYSGSVDLVRRRLARIRAERPSLAFPPAPRPGQSIEWDWVQMPTRPVVERVGERSVWALIAWLPCAGVQTAHFSFDCTLEAFLEGHVRVFEWLGGAPDSCMYMHLHRVVAKRDRRGALRWSRRFRELRRHYGFSSVVSAPELDGHGERGGAGIEEAVEQLERGLWAGLSFASLADLDERYARWRDGERGLQGDRDRWGSSNGHTRVVDPLEEERAGLRPLPVDGFDCSLRRTMRVPPEAYVRYGGCFYRAPASVVNQHVDLHASRDEVWLAHGGRRVASYPRSYRPGASVLAREG